jgi:hypothetical protein
VTDQCVSGSGPFFWSVAVVLQAFTYILIRYLIALAPFRGPRHRLRLVSGPPKNFFSHPPAPFLFYIAWHIYLHIPVHTCLFPPSSFAPRRSRPTVDFFGAPRRLPTRTGVNIYWRTAPTSTRRSSITQTYFLSRHFRRIPNQPLDLRNPRGDFPDSDH